MSEEEKGEPVPLPLENPEAVDLSNDNLGLSIHLASSLFGVVELLKMADEWMENKSKKCNNKKEARYLG